MVIDMMMIRMFVCLLFFTCLPAHAQTDLPADSSGVIYTIVQQQASFVGGQGAMAKYMRENFKYPQKCKRFSITGKIYARFVVDTDGNITNIELLKGISNCEAYSQEMIQMVHNMPKWNPAVHEGKRVKCYFSLPFIICFGE